VSEPGGLPFRVCVVKTAGKPLFYPFFSIFAKKPNRDFRQKKQKTQKRGQNCLLFSPFSLFFPKLKKTKTRIFPNKSLVILPFFVLFVKNSTFLEKTYFSKNPIFTVF
jgi:hypothetical protein